MRSKGVKILYVVTRSERGGAQAHVLDLASAAKQQGFGVTICAGEDGYLLEQARVRGIATHRFKWLVHPITPHADCKAICELSHFIRRLQPDIVHCHSSKAGLIGRFAAAVVGIPALYTAHGWEFACGLTLSRRLAVWPAEWVAARCSARIITVSKADLELAVKWKIARRHKLCLIPNGIEDCYIRANPSNGSPVSIVMVARFAAPKRQDVLLQALSQVAGDWRLTFIGDGPEEQATMALAQRLRIKPRISFLGTRSDVIEQLGRAHLFCLISTKEGLPLSILEAMRAGLPVIASEVGGIPEQLIHGETGFLVAPGDICALTARLQELIERPDLRRRMGDAGRNRYETQFMLNRMVENTWLTYESVLKASHRGQRDYPIHV